MAAIGEVAPGSEVVNEYVAKNAGTTKSDMEAAFNRGGIEELQKIATINKTMDEQLLENNKQQLTALQNIEKKVGPAGEGTDPEVDPDGRV